MAAKTATGTQILYDSSASLCADMSEGTKTLAAKTAGNAKRVYQASVAVGVDVKREIGQRVQSMDTQTQCVLVVAGTASVIGIVGKEV